MDSHSRVGYWMLDTYSEKLEMREMESYIRRKTRLRLERLTLVEGDEKVCVILHRIYDLMTSAVWGNPLAAAAIREFEEFCFTNKHIILIDSLEGSRVLQQREMFNERLKRIHFGGKIAVPRTWQLESLAVALRLCDSFHSPLVFPLICKPNEAHGTDQEGLSSDSCHDMTMIFNKKQLKDLEFPCVAQEFVDHNAVLYKLYVIGKNVHVALRPSVRNFSHSFVDQHVITFNTKDVSKKDSRSILNFGPNTGEQRYETEEMLPVFQEIAEKLKKEFGLALFGLDVVICHSTGTFYIIDLNTSPDFTCIGDFRANLEDLLLYAVRCSNTGGGQKDLYNQMCHVATFNKF